MFVVIVDIEKCRACGECVKVCPNQAFEMIAEEGRRYAIFRGDPGGRGVHGCIGCYSCQAICEDGAIRVLDL
jgi:NAD-dependent dihydropyrimidine dehydrogenase PreA subunit